jgi:hypothetical protein
MTTWSGGPHDQPYSLAAFRAAEAEFRRHNEGRSDDECVDAMLTAAYKADAVALSDFVAELRAASPPEIHSERIRRQWANSTAREIALSMAECLTEGRPVGAAIARAEEWLRGASQPGGTPIVPGAAPIVPGAPTPDERMVDVEVIRERLRRPASDFALREWAKALLREVDRREALRGRPEPEGGRLAELSVALAFALEEIMAVACDPTGLDAWHAGEMVKIARAALRDAPPQEEGGLDGNDTL